MSAGSIEFDPEPSRRLARLPEPLRRHIANEWVRLLRSPGTESKPPGSTHGAGRLFEVQTSFEGMDVFIDIVFKYAPDEMTLVITALHVDVA